MRLYYPGIEAESHEAAAPVAVAKCSDKADFIEDCEGENLAALVDVEGDEEYADTKMIDFNPDNPGLTKDAVQEILHLCQERIENDAELPHAFTWAAEELEQL